MSKGTVLNLVLNLDLVAFGPLILQKFFILYCFVFLLSGLYHDPKTTIEKNGVIWGTGGGKGWRYPTSNMVAPPSG
jgi:hypothetical protein